MRQATEAADDCFIHFGARDQGGAGACPLAFCHARIASCITCAIRSFAFVSVVETFVFIACKDPRQYFIAQR